MELLEYEKEIFVESFMSDGLLIMAKGLGIDRIFTSFLKLYSEPTNLVFVLNTTTYEEEYFRSILSKADVHLLPKTINSDTGTADRQKIYLEGGVLFITTRILVVDMLVSRVPIDHITGILVYRAHRVVDSCQEPFILRLYRQKNKTGFIKAFSESSPSFVRGFCQIERVMKSLYLRHLFLWPRFRASVVDCFDKFKIEVIELHIPMTKLMVDCQSCLIDLIDACIKEIKRSHTILDTDELSVEFALTNGFDKVIRSNLDPIWHQLSSKTKQIVADLRMLRTLLEDLIQYDCVHFCNQIDSIKTNEKNFNSNVGWLFTSSAEKLFALASDRLGMKKRAPSNTIDVDLNLELSPKLTALQEVLDEINEKFKKIGEKMSGNKDDDVVGDGDDEDAKMTRDMKDYLERSGGRIKILVLALDKRTCNQISQYLQDPKEFVERLKDNYCNLKLNLQQFHQPNQPPDKKAKKVTTKKPQPTKTSTSATTITILTNDQQTMTTKLTTSTDCITTATNVILIHPLKNPEDPNELRRLLVDEKPHFVVLYDAYVPAVREIEVYRATHAMDNEVCTLIQVYFLMYAGSTEEQRYLTELRREKEAFESLIKQKATMVIPEEREGKLEEGEGQSNQPTNQNTRKGGINDSDQSKQPKVIVDMREFRCELPSLLHMRGMSIEPVTLEVGDYIITPEICIERKSLCDLVGSLNNGRLYNQCLAMCRTYKRPVLLIEFSPNKPFTLQDKYPMSNDINSNDVMSKLTLLTIHFPKLRLLWTQSPHATAELVEELKIGREEPNADDAATVTSSSERYDDDVIGSFDKYNSTPQDMLSKMPGINRRNINVIMNKVDSVVQLSKLSQDQLNDVMGSSAQATQLHQFLNANPTAPDGSGGGGGDGDVDPSGKGKKLIKNDSALNKNSLPKKRFPLNKKKS